MKKGKKLIKQIGRMTGKRLYTVHYTLLGKLVYHLCKLGSILLNLGNFALVRL